MVIPLTASIASVLLATETDSLVSTRVNTLELDFGGCVGDRHFGLTRFSGSRDAHYYPPGTEIWNRRQVTLVAVEELAHIAQTLGVPEVKPEWLGANAATEGLPRLSSLPPGSRLLLPSGAGLICEGVNQPCRQPAAVIASHYPDSPSIFRDFVRNARGWRGIIASVERPGILRAGDRILIVEPEHHDSPPPSAPDGFVPVSRWMAET